LGESAPNNLDFSVVDILTDPPLPQYDCIVTNPPYISHEEYKKLDENVSKWEDRRALVGVEEQNQRGLLYYEHIIDFATRHLRPTSTVRRDDTIHYTKIPFHSDLPGKIDEDDENGFYYTDENLTSGPSQMPSLMMEIGESQAKGVIQLLQQSGHFQSITVYRDCFDRDRCISAVL
jgi:methylase of polypeptide subunit release factors